jgi:hypothetical protein
MPLEEAAAGYAWLRRRQMGSDRQRWPAPDDRIHAIAFGAVMPTNAFVRTHAPARGLSGHSHVADA